MMLDAKGFAEKAVKRFQTRNPFDIAESLGFDIIYVPLVGVRGFYQQLKRNKFIYINENLNDHQTRLVCAHELGHWFMHKKLNRLAPFLSPADMKQKQIVLPFVCCILMMI